MLDKNAEAHLRTVELGKDTYEQEIRELREGKLRRFLEIEEKRKAKTLQNVGKLKFSNKSETMKNQGNGEGWLDKING